MNLFGKNKNKEEIENIKQDIENMVTSIEEVKDNQKDLEKKIEFDRKEIANVERNAEHIDKVFTSLFDQYEEKFLKIDKKLENIEKQLTLLFDLQQNKKEEKPKSTSKPKKKHMFNFKIDKDLLYSQVYLNGNKIIGARGEFNFTIDDIISIKNNLKEYKDKNYSLMKIGEIHNIQRGTIQRVIYNIEEGTFDDLIKEYTNPTNKIPKSHKIQVAKSYQVHYNQELDDNGNLFKNGRQMPYHIKEIIKLKEAIYDENIHTLKEVLKDFPHNYFTGCRLVWAIEEGDFDELIETWQNKPKKQKDKSKAKHFREVPQSLQNPLSHQLEIIDGGELYNKSWGRSLGYTIQDVLIIQERIPDFNRYPTFEDLSEGFDMSLNAIKTMVWRIEEGYFDDVIQEYLLRNYTYENNFNRLFIDGENTGLSIDKCVSIVECIINNPNKTETVNKLIKMYPTINSKYIRIISDNYNNPNLSKILTRTTKKVEKIDNPQKRKEAGVFL